MSTDSSTTTSTIKTSNNNSAQSAQNDDFDSTSSPLRYLAYASRLTRFSRYLAFTSDVGEAFRPVISPSLVNASYGISFAYVLGDIGYETYKSRQRKDSTMLTTRIVVERSIFQGLASILLPAITIHTIVDQSAKAIKKSAASSPLLKRWGPSAVGLACLPLLPVVFDEPIEMGLEKVFKRVWPISQADMEKIRHHHAPHEQGGRGGVKEKHD